MRFLANENIPGEAVAALRRAGHDVAWVRFDAPGSSDETVLARAIGEQADEVQRRVAEPRPEIIPFEDVFKRYRPSGD